MLFSKCRDDEVLQKEALAQSNFQGCAMHKKAWRGSRPENHASHEVLDEKEQD